MSTTSRETPHSPKVSDMRYSSAHLLLLSRFLNPQEPETLARQACWTEALRQTVQRAACQLQDDGLLASLSVAELAEYRLKVADLRAMCKERALPVTGRKNDLVARLVEADPRGVRAALAGPTVLRCSDRGQEMAHRYLESEKAKKDSLKASVFQMLERKRFREASLAVACYEAEQVFPRGMGIDWKHYEPSHDVRTLEHIFQRTPKALKSVPRNQLCMPRIAAGMMHLFGSWSEVESHIPAGGDTGSSNDCFNEARMLLSHAVFLTAMQGFRELGPRVFIQVNNAGDEHVCPACRRLTDRQYKPDQVPELPYEGCTSRDGCRCWVTAHRT